jgi:TonB family protein
MRLCYVALRIRFSSVRWDLNISIREKFEDILMSIKVILFASAIVLSGCATTEQSVLKEEIPIEPVALPTGVYDLADLDQIPKAVKMVPPVYPYKLRKEDTDGEVLVECIVTKKGKVVGAEVVKSTHPGIEEPVLMALRFWKFEPGIKDGEPVAVRLRIPFSFTINHGDMEF